jgi:hypothetical protein
VEVNLEILPRLRREGSGGRGAEEGLLQSRAEAELEAFWESEFPRLGESVRSAGAVCGDCVHVQ